MTVRPGSRILVGKEGKEGKEEVAPMAGTKTSSDEGGVTCALRDMASVFGLGGVVRRSLGGTDEDLDSSIDTP